MKKYFNLLFLTLTVSILTSCVDKPKVLTAQDILDASIKFHDPENKWKSLNANFVFESKFESNDSVPEELLININVPENGFQYDNLDKKVSIKYNQDNCEVLKGNATCEGYQWTKNFYTYVWGLPMKLNDPATNITTIYGTHTIKKTPVYIVFVSYESEDYKFYIDQKTFELKFFEFIKNDSSMKGEFITLSGIYEYYGIKFPKHKRWDDLYTKELIGTNEVLSITNVND